MDFPAEYRLNAWAVYQQGPTSLCDYRSTCDRITTSARAASSASAHNFDGFGRIALRSPPERCVRQSDANVRIGISTRGLPRQCIASKVGPQEQRFEKRTETSYGRGGCPAETCVVARVGAGVWRPHRSLKPRFHGAPETTSILLPCSRVYARQKSSPQHIRVSYVLHALGDKELTLIVTRRRRKENERSRNRHGGLSLTICDHYATRQSSPQVPSHVSEECHG